MADTITNTTRSKNNADLRMGCIIGGGVMAVASYVCFEGGNGESGSWAAFAAISAWVIAGNIQVEWLSRTRG